METVNYHDHDGWTVTSTSFRDFLRSPEHYRHKYVLKDAPSESTRALVYGSALHCLALEPHKFADLFFVDDHRLGSAKSKWVCQENEGKERLTRREFEEVRYLSDLVRNNDYARCNIFRVSAEFEGVREAKVGRLVLKCKPDALTETAIFDLKTYGGPRHAFREHAAKLGYQVQAGFYGAVTALSGDGRERDFVILVVCKRAPYDIFPLVLPYGDLVNVWDRVCRPGLRQLQECLETNNWDTYHAEESRWALRKRDC